MYNRILDTFIAVADSGSFTKAADSLYISPTAVMKQMNTLEKDLNLVLMERTPSGISLTAAGAVIYRDAKFIIDYSKKSMADARAAMHLADTTFCVGTSLLNPAKPFMDLWYRVNKDFPEYKLHLVPFEDNHEGILEDLYGETLMMVKQRDSEVNDLLRSDLMINHPKIHIEDTPQFYDMSVFNCCAESGNVLLTIECWQDVHPGLVSVPVSWDYSIPYGLLYSLEAPEDVYRFVNEVRRLNNINSSPANLTKR